MAVELSSTKLWNEREIEKEIRLNQFLVNSPVNFGANSGDFRVLISKTQFLNLNFKIQIFKVRSQNLKFFRFESEFKEVQTLDSKDLHGELRVCLIRVCSMTIRHGLH